MPYSPGPRLPPTHPANSHCQAQTGPMNNKADIGLATGWESPASSKGTMSHVCESRCRTHTEARTHFTKAFWEGNDVAEWPVAYTATSGHRGPSVIAAAMASVQAEHRAAPGRSPKLLLPPNKSSMHSEVPRLPSPEKSPGSTCLNQPTAPGQETEDTLTHRVPLWHQGEGFRSPH